MAILPALPGVEATIVVGNQPLTEYIDDGISEASAPSQRPSPKVSKYVTAVTDQEFSVATKVTTAFIPASPSITSETYIDGRWANGVVFSTPGDRVRTSEIKAITGTNVVDEHSGVATLHHFKFTSLKLTSDEEHKPTSKKEMEKLAKIGTIEVKLFRTTAPVIVRCPASRNILREAGSVEVHEKALKGQAKSHGVSSGRTSIGSSHSITIDYLDGRDLPFAVFTFHYRSLEALKQLCIIQRTPEPEELEESTPQSRPAKHSASQKSVKRERSDKDNIKSEPGQPSTKRRKSKYKVTIDLTNDSDSDSDGGSVIAID